MHVRRARPEEEILRCLHAAFDPYRDRYTPAAFADTVPDSPEERFRTMALFVALDEDTIIGTVACEVRGRQGHLRGMAVRPDEHGAGAARLLVEAAEAELRSRGCERVTLDTTPPLERAMRFYERCGYRRTARIADFFGMPLIEFEKRLSMT